MCAKRFKANACPRPGVLAAASLQRGHGSAPNHRARLRRCVPPPCVIDARVWHVHVVEPGWDDAMVTHFFKSFSVFLHAGDVRRLACRYIDGSLEMRAALTSHMDTFVAYAPSLPYPPFVRNEQGSDSSPRLVRPKAWSCGRTYSAAL